MLRYVANHRSELL